MSIKLGIIGMGYCGRQQLQAAAADRAPLGSPLAVPCHADWRELIADSAIDAVSLCVPHDLRVEMATSAPAAGKHVLCVKRLGRTAAEAAAMAQQQARPSGAELPPVQQIIDQYYCDVADGERSA